MTLAAASTTKERMPQVVVLISGLLGVLGLGALFGGIAMTFGIGGEIMLPDTYLDALPLVNSWLLPGLVLGIGFGVGSLVALYGVLRRPAWSWLNGLQRVTGHHWSWLATILIGAGQVIWITLEVVSIPFSWLMPTFGLVGLALAFLPMTPAAKDFLRRSGPSA